MFKAAVARKGTRLATGTAFHGPPVDPPNPLRPQSPMRLTLKMKAPFSAPMAKPIPGFRFPASTHSSRRTLPTTPPNSRSILARGTASTPTIRQLSQGSGRGRLEPDAAMAEGVRRILLTTSASARHRCALAGFFRRRGARRSRSYSMRSHERRSCLSRSRANLGSSSWSIRSRRQRG